MSDDPISKVLAQLTDAEHEAQSAGNAADEARNSARQARELLESVKLYESARPEPPVDEAIPLAAQAIDQIEDGDVLLAIETLNRITGVKKFRAFENFKRRQVRQTELPKGNQG